MKKTYEPGYGFSIKPEPGMDTLEPPKLPSMRLFAVRRVLVSQSFRIEEITIAAHVVNVVDGVLCFSEYRPDDLGVGVYMIRGFKEYIDFEEIHDLHAGPKSVN